MPKMVSQSVPDFKPASYNYQNKIDKASDGRHDRKKSPKDYPFSFYNNSFLNGKRNRYGPGEPQQIEQPPAKK